MSFDQGLVTVKTQHTTVRIPVSALIRGATVMIGISAAQVDKLARTGVPRT